jgi:hypothetical protein
VSIDNFHAENGGQTPFFEESGGYEFLLRSMKEDEK